MVDIKGRAEQRDFTDLVPIDKLKSPALFWLCGVQVHEGQSRG